MLPKIGDIIIGYIEMLFGNMFSVRILYINDKKSDAGFSAIASTRLGGGAGFGRDRGDRRGRIIFRIGDIVRGRVISLLNSTIHITIDEIKCIECGSYEERKLTNDYGKETFRLIHKTGHNNN
jgi:exosome complex component CSL4